MNHIIACLDGRAHSPAFADWAAWAALRMALPLEFLHVLERHPERATAADYTGAIGPDAQSSLLNSLSEQDAQRSKAAREAGRLMLTQARARAAAAGPLKLDGRLRHGELLDTLAELAADAALVVLGEHHAEPREPRAAAEHHLERVVRDLPRSILVASTTDYAAPQRVVLAFDGSAHARQAARQLIHHPLTTGLPMLVAMAGTPDAKAQTLMEATVASLRAAGLHVQSQCLPGDPQQVLPELLQAQRAQAGPALLVMGAYGHSRWRQWLLGSTTTRLLRMGSAPVLILR